MKLKKIKKEYEALDGDYNTLKSKSDALKARYCHMHSYFSAEKTTKYSSNMNSNQRNNMLSNELKINKEQLKTLLEKGKHDDELIEALLVFSRIILYFK
jgi:hypothetical protein